MPAIHEITEANPDSSLRTEFDGTAILFDLRYFDNNKDIISFFELSLTDGSLGEDLMKVFGTVGKLHDTCFAKKQNYKVEGNGRIRIHYLIKLETD